MKQGNRGTKASDFLPSDRVDIAGLRGTVMGINKGWVTVVWGGGMPDGPFINSWRAKQITLIWRKGE
jgi:hypothetical protein